MTDDSFNRRDSVDLHPTSLHHCRPAFSCVWRLTLLDLRSGSVCSLLPSHEYPKHTIVSAEMDTYITLGTEQVKGKDATVLYASFSPLRYKDIQLVYLSIVNNCT